MRILRLIGFAIVLASAASLMPTGGSVVAAGGGGAAAPPWDCDEVCTESTSCDQPCWFHVETSTCGEYGTCDWPDPPCQPDWEVVDADWVGGVAVDYWSENYCKYYAIWDVTWQDANNCGTPAPPSCQITEEATSTAGWCCTYYYCFGQQSC